MTNEDLDRIIGQLAPSYNEPPEPRREAIWSAIENARRSSVVPMHRGSRATRWLVSVTSVAAVLVMGIAIGRYTRPASPTAVLATHTSPKDSQPANASVQAPVAGSESGAPASTRVAETRRNPRGESAVRAPSVDVSGDEAAYRVAVVQHLARTELLLTSFQSDARTVNDARLDAKFAGLTRDLLTTTRQLLATHRGDDPTMTHLLEDLELVLMQISQYATDGRTIDLDAARQSIEKRNVITKLRATIPAGT